MPKQAAGTIISTLQHAGRLMGFYLIQVCMREGVVHNFALKRVELALARQ